MTSRGRSRWTPTAAVWSLLSPSVATAEALAVVAVVSMASVEQVRTGGRDVAIQFALPAVLLVTLLIDAVTRRVCPSAHRRAAADNQARLGAGKTRVARGRSAPRRAGDGWPMG